MSTTTTNYGLFKPELTDPADITQINQNWDKIDNKLNEIEENAGNSEELSEQINTHNTDDSAHSGVLAPMYSYGTEDMTAGTSELETGKLYFVYE